MARSGDEARRRLREVALELYLENGYDQTTTAAIAARAGVTERTFFRHFKDKREVVFDGDASFIQGLSAAIAAAPAELGPLAAIRWAYCAFAEKMAGGQPLPEAHRQLIFNTPALRERQLTKMAALTDALAAALRERGVPAPQALLTAQMGVAVSGYAAQAWSDDPSSSPLTHTKRAFDEVKSLLA